MMKGRKTYLKIRFVSQTPMSRQGYKNWTPSRRGKLHKSVYGKSVVCLQVPVERIESKEAIGDLASEYLDSGEYVMFGYSHGKTPTHVKLVMMCKIRLQKNEDRHSISISKTRRLSRYWFWKR